MTDTQTNTYTVTVTDYLTHKTATYTIDAPDGDTAFTRACARLDPTNMHMISGSFHRSANDWGLR